MLTLKALRFKGIGRFVEIQTITFDSFGNLIQVDGQNNNTGGSSGSGKSTVFNALDFLFGINTTPNTILQSRLTEDPIHVSADFDYNGLPMTISRDKKLKIDINGEVTAGSSKISEEKLDQIIAIPRQLFRVLLHKKQGEKGFFLNFTPKETNDFLTDCLGLGQFKKHLISLDAKLLDLSKKKEEMMQQYKSSELALKASQDAIMTLGELPAKKIDQEGILSLKSKYELSKANLDAFLSTCQRELEELEKERPILDSSEFDASNRKRYQDELAEIDKDINNLLLSEKDRQKDKQALLYKGEKNLEDIKLVINNAQKAKEQAIDIASKIRKLRESLCPTCNQMWSNDSSKDEESKLMEEISRLREVIYFGEVAAKDLTIVSDLVTELRKEVAPQNPLAIGPLTDRRMQAERLLSVEKDKENSHYSEKNVRFKRTQEEFLTLVRNLNSKHSINVEQLRGQADVDRRLYESAITQLKMYEESRVRHENTKKGLEKQRDSYQLQFDEVSKKLSIVTTDIVFLEELKKAVKSYLSCSFDDALESIGEQATRLVRNIPNMSNATVQLMGTRETKEGKVKEEVNALLHLDGDANIDIRSLSGGERASIDLAIDLAVIDLIESKTNHGINVFILDEPFTGLDSQNIEMALEMLKNANFNKKLIVVDHNPIVKEQISDRIIVIRDEEISRIA